jgi:hypothetical protein
METGTDAEEADPPDEPLPAIPGDAVGLFAEALAADPANAGASGRVAGADDPPETADAQGEEEGTDARPEEPANAEEDALGNQQEMGADATEASPPDPAADAHGEEEGGQDKDEQDHAEVV